jgi:dTDP-4-amino-4,6-dideoxygalactose transaminase
MKNILFSPPDITEEDIDSVVETLKSGWITTGPKTKLFEKEISKYCGTEKTICLNSATAGLELGLRLFDIGEGDEVITSPYTYAATVSVILHCGARPVFADIKKNGYNIDHERISEKISEKTKVIIPVDFGGYPCDYDKIKSVVNSKKNIFSPNKNNKQKFLNRILILSDAAHSFGGVYKGKCCGSLADFTVFSFHAVKNLTTAEGGALTFNSLSDLDANELYNELQLLSLHGQSKDALSKMKAGNWKYEILFPGYKYNMTDINAALGLTQLKRYDSYILKNRKRVYNSYYEKLKMLENKIVLPDFINKEAETSYHLFPVKLNEKYTSEFRDKVICRMSEKGIALNVHFIPIVEHPYYRKMGYKLDDYPETKKTYEREISFPIYPQLTEEDIRYICDEFKKCLN